MNNKSEIIENTKNAINNLRKYAQKDQMLNNSKTLEIEYMRAINLLENRLIRARANEKNSPN